MASLAEILQDPNYVNANEATKRAIFDKYAPQDPNYSNANAATQEAIRAKFGVAQATPAAKPEGMPGPRAQAPDWAAQYPGLYKAAVGARQLVGPTAEMLGGALGGIAGGTAGTFGAGPLGTAVGGVTGAGLGYGIAKQGLRRVDEALGLAPPVTLGGEAARAVGDVAEGMQGELTGRLAAPAINYLVQKGVNVAGKAMDLNQLPKQLAAKTARESLGTPEQIAAARNALQAAEAQGLDLTAQQALAREGVIAPGAQATIERAVKRTGAVDVRAAKEAAQEAARRQMLQEVTPDLQQAIAARTAAAKPFYASADEALIPARERAFKAVPAGAVPSTPRIDPITGQPVMTPTGAVDALTNAPILKQDVSVGGAPIFKQVLDGYKYEPTLSKLMERPAIKSAIQSAETMAANKGIPFFTADGKLTGEGAHLVKLRLDDLISGSPATALEKNARDAALSSRNAWIGWVENKVPEYGMARRAFERMSPPVNQAQVLQEMVSVLEKPGGGERIGPFLNVLGRGEEAMLKRSTGQPRYQSLEEVLTPEQITKVREVARQLETEAAIGQQITAGQQRAAELIRDQLPSYRLPNIFNVFATTANKVLDTLGVKVGQKTVEKLAEASLSAKSFDELLATLPGAERSKVLKALSDPSTWSAVRAVTGPATLGLTGASQTPPMPPVNNLASDNQNQNALAR